MTMPTSPSHWEPLHSHPLLRRDRGFTVSPCLSVSISSFAVRDLRQAWNGPVPIFVVGAGGIGSRLIPVLSRYLPTLHLGASTSPVATITIIDPDTVEERNISRQHFSRSDVGKFKAEVLADRYTSRACPIRAVVDRIETVWLRTDPHAVFTSGWGNSLPAPGYGIVLGGLDNVRSRRHLLEQTLLATSQGRHVLYIDGGNDSSYGQVCVNGMWHSYAGVHAGAYAQFHGHYAFPDLFEPEGVEETENSCAAALDTQTIPANNMVAALMLGILSQFLEGHPITSLGYTFHTSGTTQPIQMSRVHSAWDGYTVLVPPETSAKWMEEANAGPTQPAGSHSPLGE